MAAQPETKLPLHRLDLETYDKIVASGALEGQHVELLDGVLTEMSPQSPSHAFAIEALTRHFADAQARLRVQLPLALEPDSEPEPDLALVEMPAAPDRHPSTALLAIEVATSSQLVDRNVKARLYARAGISTYWLVDLVARSVEIRTDPSGDGYHRLETHHPGEPVSCPVPGVDDLDPASLFSAKS
ncbi:MAG TPA: Uma2 family endonuclease [Solirubrobacteraceae bacterium]|jgi:Uma2 family endonuclease